MIAPVLGTFKTERGAHQAAARIIGAGQGASIPLADGSGYVAVDLRPGRFSSRRRTWVRISRGPQMAAQIISRTGWQLIATS